MRADAIAALLAQKTSEPFGKIFSGAPLSAAPPAAQHVSVV
jgi:hypothetical protein